MVKILWKISVESIHHDLHNLALNSWNKIRIIILKLKLSKRLVMNCDVEFS